MSKPLLPVAELARKTIAERLTRDEGGRLRFVTTTTAMPERVARLRSIGIPISEIRDQYPELTAIDVKIARIAVLLVDEELLLRVDELEGDAHRELVKRLHELAALHAAQ